MALGHPEPSNPSVVKVRPLVPLSNGLVEAARVTLVALRLVGREYPRDELLPISKGMGL
ncbi:hypothetical protein [Rhizobium phaseoli]|uniref:hypothetical protein n=1 Tax=Rhizobium phaseoli TaxID=396 RepID=UPI001484E629|nr:hypothetical protein [Rhizobium phaseoli]